MAFIKYEISNTERQREWSAVFEQSAGEAWKAKHVSKGTFGDEGDYTITETDVTAEVDAEELKKEQLRIKKKNASKRLAKILDNTKFDFSDPKDIKKAFRRIINYLEIDIENDPDQTEE